MSQFESSALSQQGRRIQSSVVASDEAFDLPAAKAGGATPLQVALKRKWGILVFAVLVTAVVGLAVKQMPVRYAASASVMVDPRQPRVSTGESLLPSQIVDLDLLRTYMEALYSPSLAVNVVEHLGLTTMPEYCAPRRSWTDLFSSGFARSPANTRRRAASSASCRTTAESAVGQLMSSVSFSNDARSYIISVSATAGSADLAAKIANAYANAFIVRRRQQQAGLTDRADAWLSTHLAQLRSALVAADNAVQQQRERGQLTSLNGQTLLGQRLLETNSQLVVAAGELAQKQSTLRQLENAQHSGAGTLDASAPVLASPIIQGLLTQESSLAAAHAELSTRLGSANTELVANAAQLKRIRQQIRVEIDKAVTSVSGEVEALQSRQAALGASVRDLQKQVDEQGTAKTRLQDLERDAATARSRYDEAALRLEQIHVDSAMQRADVQLVVEASSPKFPSFPRTRMIITGTFLAMLGVGTGLAYALELLSRVFSTPEQVEEQTGIRVLGLFPKLARGRSKLQNAIASDPNSREAEALQSVFAGLIGGRFHGDAKTGRVLMVTSSLPGEGKTSFSVALGRAAAACGLSVVLMDCDLRRSTMGNHFPMLDGQKEIAKDPARDHLAESEPDFAELAVDESSGLRVMGLRGPARNPHAVLASASLPRALEQLRANYDVVIIDTPPVLAVPDILSIAPLVDDVVMLVGWRRTPRATVHAALKALRRARIQVSGIVLSKVDLRRVARGGVGESYYGKLYPAYHALARE